MADPVYTPCLRCGEPIEHLAIRGRRRRFCSEVCRVMAKADSPPPPRPAVVYDKTCSHCGGAFQTSGKATVYCSTRCSALRQGIERRAASIARRTRPCEQCGELFVRHRRGGATYRKGVNEGRFCSRACYGLASRISADQLTTTNVAKLRRIHLKRDGEPVHAQAVFARDGWRCYLCGEPTPEELRGSHHQRAPELDHIVPLARGGAHTAANTACCCRGCNGLKGKMTAEEFITSRFGGLAPATSKGVGGSILQIPEVADRPEAIAQLNRRNPGA